MPRLLRIALALSGLIAAIYGVGLLVSAVSDADRTSRLLDGVLAIGLLRVSFAFYRSLGWKRRHAAGEVNNSSARRPEHGLPQMPSFARSGYGADVSEDRRTPA